MVNAVGEIKERRENDLTTDYNHGFHGFPRRIVNEIRGNCPLT